ncbi:MAG: hypothetical protein JWP36_2420 [Paucimonas sp.]|nr:hypothetical protein [Paucimonas sp.]
MNAALPYTARQVRSLGQANMGALRLKWYALTCEPGMAIAIEPAAASRLLDAELQLGATLQADPAEHGLGFAILHQARDGIYLLLSRWYGGNMLKHAAFRLHKGDANTPAALESLAPSGIICCVWELEIMKKERDFWVQSMMQRRPQPATPGGPDDQAAYLSLCWEGWV